VTPSRGVTPSEINESDSDRISKKTLSLGAAAVSDQIDACWVLVDIV